MRIYIVVPFGKRTRESVVSRIDELSTRVRRRGDIPLWQDIEDEGYELSREERLDGSLADMLTCDAILVDVGWKQSKVCALLYKAAEIFGKTIFHTKEEHQYLKEHYVI